jgi:hypothetical protein
VKTSSAGHSKQLIALALQPAIILKCEAHFVRCCAGQKLDRSTIDHGIPKGEPTSRAVFKVCSMAFILQLICCINCDRRPLV